MTTRARVTLEDGRVGYPAVREYELTEGPEAGLRLPCPPSIDSHGLADHPDVLAALKKTGKAASYVVGVRHPEGATLAYRIVVHDLAADEQIGQTGFWSSETHNGPRSPLVDNRRSIA